MESLILTSGDVIVEILPLGATLHRLEVPLAGGGRRNLVISRPDPTRPTSSYFGASCGRFANRIGGSRFVLDGVEYRLAANEGANQLHGGPGGFSEVVWEVVSNGEDRATLALTSPDGDQGFPGSLRVTATFTALPDGAEVVYRATTDAPTVLNLTTHPYFNLTGGVDINDHLLTMPGVDTWTVNDVAGIPTGEIRDVTGTAADFRAGRVFGQACDLADAEGITRNGGFDHNFPVRGRGLREHLRLSAAGSPTLRVLSDAPAVQVYGGDHLDRKGIAIEPQNYPDAPNHDNFPSSVLRPGAEFVTTTRWQVA